MRSSAILSILFFALLPTASFSADPKTETQQERFLIGMPEWCPYTCDNPDNPGILVEITKKIFAAKGITPEFRIYDNWKRLVYEGRKGRVDAVLAIGPNEEPALTYPLDTMVDVAITFFVRADDPWEYKGLESFEGKILLVYDNVDYGPTLQPYVDEHKNDRSRIEAATGETEEVIIHKLAAGRGDIYIEDEHVGRYMIKNQHLTNKVKLAPRHDKPELVGLGIGFSPSFAKGNDYALLIDDAIEVMKKDGTLQRIIDRYMEH